MIARCLESDAILMIVILFHLKLKDFVTEYSTPVEKFNCFIVWWTTILINDRMVVYWTIVLNNYYFIFSIRGLLGLCAVYYCVFFVWWGKAEYKFLRISFTYINTYIKLKYNLYLV